MASAESNFVPSLDHFDNQSNTTRGARKGNGNVGTLLAEFFRKERRGRIVASGAGDETVTFTTPFDDANYTIELSVLAAAGTTYVIKNGSTPALTGFVISVSAAATIHWTAKHD